MFKKIVISAALVVLTLVISSWGVVGHRAIGKIAENHLTTKARTEVQKLLGSESLAMVSTYPDEVRSYEKFAYTAPWHYVNVPSGLPYAEFASQLKEMEKPNIYNAIQNCIADLKNTSKTREEKIFALKFLVHLVGDLHQPMHTGRSEDSGGNGIKVKLMRKEQNLHSLWDSGLIDYAGMTYSELATACDNAKAEDIKQWQKDDVTKWAFESYEISALLYVDAAQSPDFDYTYYPKYADTVKKRLVQAGIRLAGILNDIYK